jgi:isopenicillin-N epimerase
MLSPKGAGFIFAHRDVQSLIEPLVVSWGYHPNQLAASNSSFVDYLQWNGTRDPAAALSIPAAIRFMEEHNWGVIRDNCHQILRHAIERISDLSGLTPPYPLESNFYHQMGIAPLPHIRDLNQLKNRLYDEYKIEIPCIEWNNQHFLRLSIQGYNTEQDIDKLISALDKLIPELAA